MNFSTSDRKKMKWISGTKKKIGFGVLHLGLFVSGGLFFDTTKRHIFRVYISIGTIGLQ